MILHCRFYYALGIKIGGKQVIKEAEINERIRDASLRVIDENGQQLGIMTGMEAKRLAREKNLDIVKINPGAVPPVAKIMDYGKFKFEQSKKEKVARKTQKVSELKEMRLSMTIDTGDIQTKARVTGKFLTAGDKVKVTLRMRGRQAAHADIGVRVMNEFFEILKDVCVVEKKPAQEGRQIYMILAPKK